MPEPWQMVMDALARIERRLDGLVTIETHAADLRRVDDRLTDLATDIGIERAARAEQQAKLDSRIEQLTAALSAETDNRRKDVEAESASRKRDRQWTFGAIIAVAGVVAAFAQVLLR